MMSSRYFRLWRLDAHQRTQAVAPLNFLIHQRIINELRHILDFFVRIGKRISVHLIKQICVDARRNIERIVAKLMPLDCHFPCTSSRLRIVDDDITCVDIAGNRMNERILKVDILELHFVRFLSFVLCIAANNGSVAVR